MDERDDAQLDALLRQAAPDAAPAGLAHRVVAATRARRARRRLIRLAAAAAAALAVGGAVRLGLESGADGAKPLATNAMRAPLEPEPVSPAPTPSPAFAAVLASSGEAAHRVILGHFDNKLVVFARPNVRGADAPAPSPRAFAATVGYETLD
ncbi:MAG TPA: hypothetical protein PLE19_08455 [Planctomycetota bacterium]|nr:hypothetical protein [Planctomycetota bacterium]HRR80913.1 hypothetical protein [Planctomycetota bacterium]HRT93855.1 hypothetical protein [Planctomycetota bacterium]